MHKWVLPTWKEGAMAHREMGAVMAHYRLSFDLRFFADAGTVKS